MVFSVKSVHGFRLISKLTSLNEQKEEVISSPLYFFISPIAVFLVIFFQLFYLIPAMHFGKMKTPPSFSLWSITKMTREKICLTNIFLRDAGYNIYVYGKVYTVKVL